MYGQLGIGGHNGNKLRCIGHFFYKYLYILMQNYNLNTNKVMFKSLKLLPWKQSLNIIVLEIIGIFD